MKIHAVEYQSLNKEDTDQIRECARLMSLSEPWITLRRTQADVVKTIKDEMSEVHLAIVQNKIIGFAIIKMQGAFVGYIQSIVIALQYRRRGIGKRFIEYLERRILSEQPNVFICVSSFNPEAKRLYERLGYETIGVLKDYIVSGHDEILMRKSVSPLSEYTHERT